MTAIVQMLAVNKTTIIVSVVVVALAIIASFVNPFVRGIKWTATEEDAEEETDTTETDVESYTETEANDIDKTEVEVKVNAETKAATATTPITLLITAHDNLHELSRNLPAFLDQDYQDYQVVVVCQKTDSETQDLLKRLSAEHPQLYYTFIPESSRYMSRKKLQITLGVKAAKTEWIVLTEPTCRPQSRGWLRAMARQCNEENHLVLGYVGLDQQTSGYRRFENIRTAYYLLRRAQRSGGYRTHMANVAFRKSDFMREQGFYGNLELERGEYDLLVNKYATMGNTAVELSTASWLQREEPSDKAWSYAHLYLLASLRSLRRVHSMRMLKGIDHLLPHLSLTLSAAALIYSLLTEQWIITIASAIAILLLYILRAVIARKAVSRFDDSLSALALPFYEYSTVWRTAVRRIRYWRADKNDFISHKL